MFPGLKNQRVIVTAAAAGVGRRIAEQFIEAEARVHVCDIDSDALQEFGDANTPVGATICDVADSAAVDRLFEQALAGLGGLDVLVNNAGVAGPAAEAESITPDQWRRTIAVNLDGQFFCLRRAVPVLKQQGSGSIVNIASSAGLFGCPLRAPYAASKWGVIGLTKTLAMELGPYGIRVNAICPGSVEGERIERVIRAEARASGLSTDEVRASYLAQTSLRTLISAEDVANLVLFICSDAGAKISGQALGVDGHTETLAT